MDGIKRFKLARQTASKPVEVQNKLDELVKMYEAIGPQDAALKHDLNKCWDKLPEEKRSELVKSLLALGLLPQEVSDALEIFNGKVTRLV